MRGRPAGHGTHALRHVVAGVSVGVATVADMTSTASTSTHACVFFDDGDLELRCGCGGQALRLDDEDGIVVVLYREPSPVTRLPGGVYRLLAVSA